MSDVVYIESAVMDKGLDNYKFRMELKTDGCYYCTVMCNGVAIGSGIFTDSVSAGHYLDKVRYEYSK